jgi:hypothetical protein
MKMFSSSMKFIILPALAISSILALQMFAAESPKKDYPVAKFVFKADHMKKLKPGREEAAHFKSVLDKHNAVYYCMTHTHNGKATPLKKGQCPEMVGSASSDITDNKEFTLICAGAHVTQQAGFSSQGDLDAVADEFE